MEGEEGRSERSGRKEREREGEGEGLDREARERIGNRENEKKR
jgi:hypothetical protein